MLDEARLLLLARRVYGEPATVHVHGKAARVEHGAATMLHVYGDRCADALEAALLVLAGETPRKRAETFFASLPEPPHGLLAVAAPPIDPEAQRMVDEAAEQAAKVQQKRRLVPAWVEQLASEIDEMKGEGGEIAGWAEQLAAIVGKAWPNAGRPSPDTKNTR